MKLTQNIQIGLIAIVSLIVGILIGAVLQWPNLDNSSLKGTIGRADRYRNVQITENDIMLRNELLGDTEKQELYKNYLNYYYIRAMRTSDVLNRSVASARQVPDFQGTFLDYADGLSGFANYLDAARTDILKAIDVVVSLEANPRIPVVEYLNQANNVIARMRQYDHVLIDFMIAIESFLDLRPNADFPGLADAHDMLAMSLMESALVTQSKPMLNMLDKKKLANDEEGVKELLMSVELGFIIIVNQFNLDVEKLDFTYTDAELLGLKVGMGSEQAVGSQPLFYNMDVLGSAVAGNSQLGDIHFDAEQLGRLFNFDQLGKIIFTDSEMLKQF